jgi:hypothetical protein
MISWRLSLNASIPSYHLFFPAVLSLRWLLPPQCHPPQNQLPLNNIEITNLQHKSHRPTLEVLGVPPTSPPVIEQQIYDRLFTDGHPRLKAQPILLPTKFCRDPLEENTF